MEDASDSFLSRNDCWDRFAANFSPHYFFLRFAVIFFSTGSPAKVAFVSFLDWDVILGAHVTVPCGTNTNLLTRAFYPGTTLVIIGNGDRKNRVVGHGSLVPRTARFFSFFFSLIGK